MFTCQKTYADVPFAHRQHMHEGHCAFIHGHNWSFTFVFGCRELDECGFVLDFGKLKGIKRWIDDNLDHACLFNEDDPMRERFMEMKDELGRPVFKSYVLDRCSSEGLAKHLYDVATPIVRDQTEGRAFIVSVNVTEDAKNSATYHAPALDA
ncbi:MAG: 6-carboxytetrahydropterin synthase [Verrucomicrobiota bacterium]